MDLPEPPWEEVSSPPALPDDEVHVWQVTLPRSAGQVESFLRLLSADERERAGRFLSPRHRDYFIVARGALRALLGRYLGIAPEALRFCYSPHGKPALEGSALCFNLSHSGGLALCAFSRLRAVGVDVEHLRPDIDIDSLARRFFSDREAEVLRAAPPALRCAAFFNCWTRKEAYLKARGKGITGLPLDSFSVSLLPGELPALLCADHDPEAVSHWTLQALYPQANYLGALCVEGTGWRLRRFRWSAPEGQI